MMICVFRRVPLLIPLLIVALLLSGCAAKSDSTLDTMAASLISVQDGAMRPAAAPFGASVQDVQLATGWQEPYDADMQQLLHTSTLKPRNTQAVIRYVFEQDHLVSLWVDVNVDEAGAQEVLDTLTAQLASLLPGDWQTTSQPARWQDADRSWVQVSDGSAGVSQGRSVTIQLHCDPDVAKAWFTGTE